MENEEEARMIIKLEAIFELAAKCQFCSGQVFYSINLFDGCA